MRKEERGTLLPASFASPALRIPGRQAASDLRKQALSGFGRVDAGCWRLIASMASSAPAIEVRGRLSMAVHCGSAAHPVPTWTTFTLWC